MNKILRTMMVAAVAASLLGAGPAMAQPGAPGQGPAGQRGQMAHRGQGQRGHGLQRLVRELNLTEAQKQQIQPIVQSFRQEAQTRREAHFNQMKSVLTPDQQARLEQMKADRGQGQGRGPGLQQLNLTDEQKTQLQSMRQQHQAEGKAALDRLLAQVKPILTAEQQATLEKFLQQRQQRQGPRGGGPRGGGGQGFAF